MSTYRASALVLVAFACLAAQRPVLPDAPTDSATTIKGADVDLVRTVRVVGERIARIVQVDRASSVVAVRADDAARSAEAASRAQRLLPTATAAARGRAWADLGLGSGNEPRDLVAFIVRDLAGMTFDSSGSRLLVDPQRLLDDVGHGDPDVDTDASVLLTTGVTPDESLAGHYLAHALLDGPDPEAPCTTDAFLARSALAEGSANLAALVFLFGGLGLESEVVSGALRPEDVLGGRLVPEGMRSGSPVIASFLEFVYLDGFAQSAALARKGGFRRLALERTTRHTSRDVLHADRAPAAAVEIPPPALPASLALSLGDRDSLGEQGIITLVSLLTGKDNLGLIAGDGWAGDALWRYDDAARTPPEGGDGATIWVTRWLTDEDANDFSYAIERCLTARFPAENLEDDPARGGRVLRRTDRIYRIQKNGLEVVVGAMASRIDAKLGPVAKKKGSPAPQKAPRKLK
jgi:hypothetical protein